MYNEELIAEYIINYMNGTISNSKLQHILFFVQAFFLAVKNYPCFKEELVASNSGPCLISVYKKYQKYGDDLIPTTNRTITLFEDDTVLINDMLDRLKYYEVDALHDIVSKEQVFQEAFNLETRIISKQRLRAVLRQD